MDGIGGAGGQDWTDDLRFTKPLLPSFGFFNIYGKLQLNRREIKEL